MKRRISALLALVMIIVCLSACAGGTPPEATPVPEVSASPEVTPEPEKEPDRYDLAYAQYGPDEVVMTINGEEVTWEEYFYWIYSIAYQLQQMYEVDWSADLDGQFTYQSYAQDYADAMLTQYWTITQKADELSLEISAEQQARIDSIYSDDVTQYSGGDESAFAEVLAGRHIPRSMYDKMNVASIDYLNIFEHYFGYMGENLPDADALTYAQDSGYMHAKHILLRTVDDSRTPLADEEIEAKRALAEELLSQLKGLSGEELEAKFDELMTENSEDTGLVSAPNGYYFLPGAMVQPFEQGVLALGDGELSPEPVESEYGYHIILRLPLDIDEEMDINGYNLRYLAAAALFDNMSEEWFEEAKVEYTEKFKELDFNALFGSPETETLPEASAVPESPAPAEPSAAPEASPAP